MNAAAAFVERLDDHQKNELADLVERKAWAMASRVAPFSGKEHKAIVRAEREGGTRLKRDVQERLYRRHHWDSLRWFLFGGYVDIPNLPSDPSLPYHPLTNPYAKVWQPGFVQTVDEHDEADPVKTMPDKDYLRLMAYTWVYRDLMLVPKSRQLMVSWLFCAIGLHNLISRQAQRMAFISKKEEDADALLERSYEISKNLPHGRLHIPQLRRVKNELSNVDNGSLMTAMNQSAKGLRSYTWSWVFADEAAFQVEFDQTLTAAMAAVRGGGRMTAVSTPDGQETFYKLVSANGAIPTPAGA